MSAGRRPTPELEARFDAELARAARALVVQELPRGILDASLAPTGGGSAGVRARRSLPGYAGIAAALVLLLATAIALAPGGGPSGPPTASPLATPSAAETAPASPAPTRGAVVPGTFRSTLDMQTDFTRLHYACVAGNSVLPKGPSPSAVVLEGAICTAPADAGPYIAAVVIGEAADGRVVEVHVKADLTGADTAPTRDEIAVPLAKAVAIAASGQATANQLAAWVIGVVPSLAPGSANSTELLGFSIKLIRSSSGTYQLLLHEAPAQP